MKRIMIGLFGALSGVLLDSDLALSQAVLERYLLEGLRNNQSIQQQSFVLEKAALALQEAQSLFNPTIAFQMDYFLAAGGRTVDFPVGNLLNPVYQSLNELTNSNRFPTLENQSILLNPNNFYDAKIRTSFPLLHLDIALLKRIKSDQVSLQLLQMEWYKRELIKNIKSAYFQYLQAVQSIKIYENALQLAAENKRINEVLLANNKVNPTVVLRAQNEWTKFEALRGNAVLISQNAKTYFNFLLNKNLEDSIMVDSTFFQLPSINPPSLSVAQREEFQQLKTALRINEHQINLAKVSSLPKISAFLDLGSQSFNWQWNNNSRYYFLGTSLQWTLFNGGRNKLKIKEARVDRQILLSQTDELETQIELQTIQAWNQYQTAVLLFRAELSSHQTAQKYFSDLLKLYKEGRALYIELLDAQTQFIQSELQLNIQRFEAFRKAAEYERVSASFPLKNISL